MKVYISYFWNVRNLPHWAIPISTAKFDPAWYHNGKDPSHQFIDARGVYNGLRAEVFVPNNKLEGLCGGSCGKQSPECAFLTGYREQLDQLDFVDITKRLEDLTIKVADYMELGATDPICPVLLVHEAPDNKCSERWALMDWFYEHGVLLEEWPVPPKRKKKQEFNF